MKREIRAQQDCTKGGKCGLDGILANEVFALSVRRMQESERQYLLPETGHRGKLDAIHKWEK
ncbi:MAG: hypothetical protein ACLTDV_11960 [Eubacterium sp.]